MTSVEIKEEDVDAVVASPTPDIPVHAANVMADLNMSVEVKEEDVEAAIASPSPVHGGDDASLKHDIDGGPSATQRVGDFKLLNLKHRFSCDLKHLAMHRRRHTEPVGNETHTHRQKNTKSITDIKRAYNKNSCTLCRVQFWSESEARYHRKAHTVNKDYRCSECAQRFGNAEVLRQHSLLHKHRYQCSRCNKPFVLYKWYQKHQVSCPVNLAQDGPGPPEEKASESPDKEAPESPQKEAPESPQKEAPESPEEDVEKAHQYGSRLSRLAAKSPDNTAMSEKYSFKPEGRRSRRLEQTAVGGRPEEQSAEFDSKSDVKQIKLEPHDPAETDVDAENITACLNMSVEVKEEVVETVASSSPPADGGDVSPEDASGGHIYSEFRPMRKCVRNDISGSKNLRCNLCGYVGETNYRLNQHSMTHMNSSVLRCDYMTSSSIQCPRVFMDKPSLVEHQQTHKRRLQPAALSKNCDKKFPKYRKFPKNTENSHRRVLFNELHRYPFLFDIKCRYCGRVFSRPHYHSKHEAGCDLNPGANLSPEQMTVLFGTYTFVPEQETTENAVQTWEAVSPASATAQPKTRRYTLYNVGAL